jgi:two-component system chemotaxis response regulator CheB
MNGLEVTEQVMAHFPTPILIVSASTNRGELFRTYEALAAGAVDVLEKPLGDEADGVWERQLVAAVRIVARVQVITHPRARLGRLGRAGAWKTAAPTAARSLLAIGASTGGPGAVLTVLRGLPHGFPLLTVVVIHIGAPFATALADWLAAETGHPVRPASDGERLPGPGQVLLAPADLHLSIDGGRLRLSDGPPRHSCRPSVDVLFESVAAELGNRAIGCLLTGMGRDGADGLLAMRRAGGATIAQDEASSVVFGMPREAIRLGAAEQVLPLDGIAAAVVALSRPGPGEPQ